ncbi:MAG: 16S rRNA (guanine(966)-N(2))-methyltransferase RsmD [Gammaproteobacteria bacterium]|nr:16S rRNA (guanine(966)-N(2))-methyltransferase RsmD [Gammaproteobacteria bacterium]
MRIIAGRWRGSRLQVPDLPGLRPTGDRARETVFNWLQMHLRDARCADLFAGTGALGLEAASRGAAEVVLVEKQAHACAALRENIARLRADNVRLVEGDALTWLDGCAPGSLDIVFVDPPFGKGLGRPVLERLADLGVVREGGLVYLETARDEDAVAPGKPWEVLKDKALGEVRMRLLRRAAPP